MSYHATSDFRAIHGKIAGLGLGDAAFDQAMAAYAADHARWVNEKATRDALVASINQKTALQGQAYGAQMAAYSSALAQWNQYSAAYAAALIAMSRQQAVNASLISRGVAAAKAAGASIPAGVTCVTQAQHDAWAADCARLSAAVKGLGAAPSGPSCALANLAVCPAPISAPVPPPAKPVPPAPPAALPLPPPLRAEPVPPRPATLVPAPTSTLVPSNPTTPAVIQTAPQAIPPSSAIDPGGAPPPPATPAPVARAGLIKNGLLVVILGAGGYALYRTFKKPKAA